MIAIREAVPADIPFIMETERLDGNDRLISQWSAEQHRAGLEDRSMAHLIGWAGGERLGFCLIEDLAGSWGNVKLRTMAVARPGEGAGGRILPLVIGWVFGWEETHRFYLHARGDNERALRCYRRAGFVEEGRDRESFLLPDGARTDMVNLSILRPEWAALSSASAG